MINEEMKYNYALLKQASKDLNLDFETQDWGIINSDGDRSEEFMCYFLENPTLKNTLRYEIFELIVASFNDAILDGKVTENLKVKFVKLLNNVSKEKVFRPILDYWKSIEDEEEYPVSKLWR